ncbi:hypothetical protein P43SY_000016 [Pythium insidiosum]|uniref:Myb-like DNA-binding protein n=1 Tax=Pythium insidiosum TaxID=114742 RepID=A0AAD5Q9Y3_PYTIN|nr:hypothetical protein P43SY_000016 [Pythium insidiosum]KAJ0406859.1 hypothetical protein ATCC90586_002889 [Pythium insidiosum]
MTISKRVQQQYFVQSPIASADALIRIPPTILPQPDAEPADADTRRRRRTNVWTESEHERFLEALQCFPSGPWKRIAAHVGTKTTRQTMTHAQKYREKIARWTRSNRAAVLSPPSSFVIEPSMTAATAMDSGVGEAPSDADDETPFLDDIVDSMVGDWTTDEFDDWLRDLEEHANAPS